MDHQELKEWWLESRGNRSLLDVRVDTEGREYVHMWNGPMNSFKPVHIPDYTDLLELKKQIEI